jgi:hypothetical protein
MASENISVADRLLNGAHVIGDAWRAGDRCQKAWSLENPQDGSPAPDAWICGCGFPHARGDGPRTRFCRAKIQWTALAIQEGREPRIGEWEFALLMNASEWDATGLAMNLDLGEAGKVRAGAKPHAEITMIELTRLCHAPESLAGVLRILRAFPGSKLDATGKPSS